MRSRNQYLQTFPRCQLWFNHQSNGRDSFIHKITFSRGKYVRRILMDEARILSEMNVALPHNLLTLLSLLNNVFNGYTVKKDFFLKRKKTKHFFMPSLVMIRVLTLALVIFFLAIFGFLCLFRKMTKNYYATCPCSLLLLKAFSYIWFKKMKLCSPSPLYFVHKREKSERKECPSYCQQAPLQPGVCQHSRETIKRAKKSKKRVELVSRNLEDLLCHFHTLL